ncbi:MAG: OmpA family protein, partial [Proteobacteria bacterium]|nr:OmpA family protein [Pseudomonadota bacterium]
ELRGLTNAEWDQLTPVGSMQVKAISFGRGTARLNINSQRELDALVRRLHSLPHFYLTVKGHTRAEGDADANRKLAEERAQAAMDYLVTKGVKPIRLRSVATEPVGTGGAFQSVSFVLAQQPY